MKKSKFSLYASLFKFRITVNVVLTTFIGFYIGESYQHQFVPDANLLINTLLGTALVCSGVCCLNHVLEWKEDLLMDRTKNRPIPSGRVSVMEATIMGILFIGIGLIQMYWTISVTMMVGALATCILYLFVYTPMKKISWWNTTVGAIPGALPILGGWVAARSQFGLEGWILFLILFFWQHPHFYAIAWVTKEDYRKAGYQMISTEDESGLKTTVLSLFFTVLMFIASFGILFTDFSAGLVYSGGMLVLNCWFLWQTIQLYRLRTNSAARKVITASVIYLTCMFSLFFVDQQWYYGTLEMLN